MHLVYIDDSKGSGHTCFSAVIIPAERWMEALDHLVGMRAAMHASDNIYTSKELHATEWLGGRGRIAKTPVPKGARVRLFDYVLSAITLLPGVQIINAIDQDHHEDTLFERLINRIHVAVYYAGSRAIIFSDEGKDYSGMLRRMRRFNHIPSAFGSWPKGSMTKNIPTDLGRHRSSKVTSQLFRPSGGLLCIQPAAQRASNERSHQAWV
jgi:hypothetical protein